MGIVPRFRGMANRKGGTRKRSPGRKGAAAVQRTLSTASRPWYLGRWAATGRQIVPGRRSKRTGRFL